MFALCYKINCKLKPGLIRLTKLFSKLSPSFPEGANPLPSHNYEGVTLKLVVQEAMKQEPAVTTLHNTQAKHINSTHIHIFVSINLGKYNHKHQQGCRSILKSLLLGNRNIEFCRQCWKSADPNPSLAFGAS